MNERTRDDLIAYRDLAFTSESLTFSPWPGERCLWDGKLVADKFKKSAVRTQKAQSVFTSLLLLFNIIK